MRIIRNEQNNQNLNKRIESIVKELKKDLLRLQSDLSEKKQTTNNTIT